MRATLVFLTLALLSPVAEAQVQPTLTKEQLYEWMQEAFAAAEKIPADQRRDYAREMSEPEGSQEERIKSALRVIAARPTYWPGFDLLRVVRHRWTYDPQAEANRTVAEEFLLELYGSRAGTGNEAALAWQQGLAELYLLLGQADKALPLMREVIKTFHGGYPLALWAVIEKANGNEAAYTQTIAHCPDPAEDYGNDYCFGVARSLAQRAVDLRTLDRTPALQEILGGHDTGVSWPERMTALNALLYGNADSAEKELNAVYSSQKTTAEQKADVLHLMAVLAMGRDHERAASLLGCWMQSRGVSLPQATATTWKEIAALDLLPEEKEKLPTNSMNCWFREEVDPAGPCVVWVLESRLEAAAKSGNQAVARQTIEQLAAIVTTHGAGTDNLWRMLWSYSSSFRPDESGFDFAKLIATREAMATVEQREALRRKPNRLTQPWPSPTKVEAPKSCP